jgi:hypothetical protein
MKQCDEIKVLLPEYIDGMLDENSSVLVEDHLKSCSSCKKYFEELQSFLGEINVAQEVEIPEGMKEEFEEMAGLQSPQSGKTIYFPGWLKVAASVLIVAGTFLVGYRSGSDKKEINNLQSELLSMKQQVMLAGLQDYSGPQRIKAVYDISSSGEVDDNLVSALVHTMNSDKNVNVRLAAINALSGMMDKNSQIKHELIKSLAVQDNPLLQISLIQVLTESGVKEAKDEIESLSKDKNTDEQVKEYAESVVKTII